MRTTIDFFKHSSIHCDSGPDRLRAVLRACVRRSLRARLAAAPAVLFVAALACNGDDASVSLPPVEDQPVELESGGEVDPIAVSAAERGGTYNVWGGPFPKTLNSWLDNWATTAEINSLLFHSLIDLHSTQDKPVGDLASDWKQAADGKTFTFSIHPDAKWSDGTPVTARDVQFYYDVIMNKEHLTTIYRVIVGRFERPEIIDDKTVRITAKEKYWKAFWDAGGFFAFPAHVWEGKNFNEVNFEFPVVNGPYKVREVRRNRYVLLERRGDWWGRVKRYNQGKFNFDYIRYKFMEDRNAALEAFKKGDYDMYAVYTSSIWADQTPELEAVQKNHVVRQQVYNQEPRGFQGMAINMRRPQFSDKRVRLALQHLFNRELMNEKLMFNAYILLDSYFPDLYPGYDNPSVEYRAYDPDKARELLDDAGWAVGPDGIRAKDGQKLTVSFLTYASEMRHLNVYLQDLKKAGIDAKIEQRSKTEVTRLTDSFQFDMFWMNTGGSRLKDPEPLFHSSEAEREASYNLPGVADEQIDGYLEELRRAQDLNRRSAILKQMDARLREIVPYVLMWQSNNSRLLYWNKFGTPEYVLNKYSRENSAVVYWWIDPGKAQALEEARASGESLPDEPDEIRYAGP